MNELDMFYISSSQKKPEKSFYFSHLILHYTAQLQSLDIDREQKKKKQKTGRQNTCFDRIHVFIFLSLSVLIGS